MNTGTSTRRNPAVCTLHYYAKIVNLSHKPLMTNCAKTKYCGLNYCWALCHICCSIVIVGCLKSVLFIVYLMALTLWYLQLIFQDTLLYLPNFRFKYTRSDDCSIYCLSMASCQTAVSLLLTRWRCCSHAGHHRYVVWIIGYPQPSKVIYS